MQKFVITYNTGEYESYTEHTHTVNANNEQDILDELNRNLPAFVECNRRFRTAVNSRPVISLSDDIHEKIKKIRESVEWEKQYQEQIVETDGFLKFTFPCFNKEISVDNVDGTTLEELFPDLRIQTLADWFDKNCVN